MAGKIISGDTQGHENGAAETVVFHEEATWEFPDAAGIGVQDGALVVLGTSGTVSAAFAPGTWGVALSKGTRYTAEVTDSDGDSEPPVIDHVGVR